MKTITKSIIMAMALAVLALTPYPYTPSPRQGQIDRTTQAQWSPELNPKADKPGQAHPDGAALVVSDFNHGVTATDLVNALVGTNVTVSNVTFTGSVRAAGTFTGGATVVGFESGIVLSCGKVQTVSPGDSGCSQGVEGPNTCFEPSSSNSTDFALPGDANLTALSGFPTFDATILEFDFVPEFPTVQFQYVFASEEYSDYSNTEFNDVFAFFVNGVNCAVIPGTTEPVSINSINNGNDAGGDTTPHHPELFLDNVRPTVTINTQMDGLTVVLTCTSNVTPGVSNHMKLAIADASDHVLDSVVFLKANSLISGTVITTSLTGGGHTGAAITVTEGTMVTDAATLSGANASTAGGTVSYKVFSDPNCQTQFADAGTKTVTNGQVPNSNPIVFNSSGVYYWQASYGGDALNNPSSTNCGDETVTVTQPTPTPTPPSTPTPPPTPSPTATPTPSPTPPPTATPTPTPTATPTPHPSATPTPGSTPPCPTITIKPVTLPNGTLGHAYSKTITAVGGHGPYVFTVSSGILPPGLTLAPGGLLSGTPTTEGTFEFTILATDSHGCTGKQHYWVAFSCPNITLTPTTLPNGVVGQPYSKTITANNGSSPYNFVLRYGSLPTGLSLSTGGLLSGTPIKKGTFSFYIDVKDAYGCGTMKLYKLVINHN